MARHVILKYTLSVIVQFELLSQTVSIFNNRNTGLRIFFSFRACVVQLEQMEAKERKEALVTLGQRARLEKMASRAYK